MSEKNKISLFDTGLMVLVIPAILYLFVYMFEFGYLSTFNIPSEYINIDIVVIIDIFIKHIYKFIILLQLWLLVSQILHIKDLQNPIIYQAYNILKFPVLAGIVALFSVEYKELILATLIGTGFLFAIFFLLPLLTQRKIKGYKNKIIEQNKLEYELHVNSIKHNVISRIGRKNIEFIVSIIFVAFLLFQTGKADAVTNDTYIVYENQIVIRSYGEYLITCDYLELTETILTDKFSIVLMNNLEDLELKHINFNDVWIK